MKALRSVRDECACGAGRGWEGLGRRGWKGKGRRERKSFKDQGTAVGAIFSFPVTLCSLTELTGSRHRKVGHHNGGQVKRDKDRGVSCTLDPALSGQSLQDSQAHPGGPGHSFLLAGVDWSLSPL